MPHVARALISMPLGSPFNNPTDLRHLCVNLPEVNLCDLFDLSLKLRRDAVALEFKGNEYTFGEMDSRSNRLAHFLAGKGFIKGDRLCVYLVNSIEMIDIYLACVKLGVIFVPINILYRDREITSTSSQTQTRGL